MTTTWEPAGRGVLRLPSGRLIRGRGLRRPVPDGPAPTFAVHLAGRQPPAAPWPCCWIRWIDFWLPSDRRQARDMLHEAWLRADTERVEVTCAGGRGPWRPGGA